MDLPRLCRQKHLSRLHTDINTFHSSKSQVTPWTMQHDCAATIYHVRLKQHLVDLAVIVDNFEFRRWQVEAPVAEILIDYIDSMIFKGGIEACTLKDFAKNAHGVDEVGEGAKNGKAGKEGRIIIVLERVGVWNLLVF